MGLVMPLGKDLLLSPNERSLIGIISVEGLKAEKPKVVKAEPRKVGDAFVVTGEMLRAGESMRQRFAFVTLANGRTIYVDDLCVIKPVKNAQVNLGALAVLNDPNWIYHDGNRDLYWSDNHRTFDVRDGKAPQPASMASRWYNLDDKLGIVAATITGGQTYDDNRKIVNGRLEQLFVLNALSTGTTQLEPSDTPIAKTALVFYPGSNRNQTAAAAERVNADWSGIESCCLTMDDGIFMTVNLADGTVKFGLGRCELINIPETVSEGANNAGQ